MDNGLDIVEDDKMKKDNLLNKIDTTFYFIIDSEDKNLKVTDHAADKICEKFEGIVQAAVYMIRTGPDLRSSAKLKEEFSATIPEQINVIYISKASDEITLLNTKDRDDFYNRIIESENDEDTLPIIKEII